MNNFARNSAYGLAAVPGLGLARAANATGSPINPQGPVGAKQLDLLEDTVLLMMPIFVIVTVILLVIILRFRAGNAKGRYRPNWEGSARIETLVWGLPFVIVLAIAAIVITSTRALDPWRELSADPPPTQVQVISLDWKYLFIYPDLGVASVNELVFPADRPVELSMTSDATMTALFIPALGGQVYAMAGMVTKLNLAADGPVETQGRNSLYNGDGFVKQTFDVRAMSPDDFATWSEQAQSAPELTKDAYAMLSKPGPADTALFGTLPDTFFKDIVMAYMTPAKAAQTPRYP